MRVFSGGGGAVQGNSYVDRGDPAAVDFAVGDLTTNGTYRDLDLSSIVPAGATSVVLYVAIQDAAAHVAVRFRKNGNSNDINTPSVSCVAGAGIANRGILIVGVDSNRVIEYNATNTTIDTLNITVSGWFV